MKVRKTGNYIIKNNQNAALPSSQQGIHTTGDYGIDALNSYLAITDNKIYLDHDLNQVNNSIANGTNPFTGINIDNCPYAFVNCNLVNGNSNAAPQQTPNLSDFQCRRAITTSFSREGWFDCNATDMTETGMEFLADCDRTTVRGNSFRTHNFGFKLGATFNAGGPCSSWSTGIIGDQATYNDNGTDYTYGNRFEGSNGSGNFGMASMHSANSYASTTPFGVFYQWIYKDINPIYFPPLPPYTLDNCAGIPGASPFAPSIDPALPFYTCISCPNLQPLNPDEELEQRISEANSVGNNQYGNQTSLIKSSTKGGLYKIIDDDATLLGSNTISSFYYTIKNSNIGKLIDVQTMIAEIVSDSDSVSVTTTKANAIALNNAIATSYIFEQNQKEINALLLSHNGNITVANILSSEKIIAENIAWQCPYKGGKAVFDARGLVWKYNPGAKFNDEALCNDGAYFREGKNNTGVINKTKLVPNPASNLVTLFYDNQKGNNLSAAIFDITGREIISLILSSKQTSVDISLNAFLQGVYVVKIYINSSVIETLKLSVIK